jgi:P27 family predicted phage terminase small subunit
LEITMTRGRRPKPAALRERQGNPGKRAVAKDAAPDVPEIEPDEVSVKVPADLTGGAAAVWREIAPLLTAMRFVKASDLQALKRYCVWVSTWWDAAKDVEKNGSHYETSSPHVDKMLRLNPAFSVMRVSEDRCQDLEDRFGFNPAGRMRIASHLAAGGAAREQPLPGLDTGDPTGAGAPGGATPRPVAPGSESGSARGSALGALNRGGAVH